MVSLVLSENKILENDEELIKAFNHYFKKNHKNDSYKDFLSKISSLNLNNFILDLANSIKKSLSNRYVFNFFFFFFFFFFLIREIFLKLR